LNRQHTRVLYTAGPDARQLAEALRHHRPDRLLVCLPLVMIDAIRDAVAAADEVGADWRFLPTLADQLAGRVSPPLGRRPTQDRRVAANAAAGDRPVAARISPGVLGPASIDPLALLDRDPRPLDRDAIASILAGKNVLITGAGGSIGSHLARLAAGFGPARLVLIERAENPLFEIDRRIAGDFPDLPRAAVLHDVTQRTRTRNLLAHHRPDVVFHAAAHKHVPMMEEHPAEAVENNFVGTRSIVDAAVAAGAGRFVMISTDKAVHPTSVMGATKRLAELYIQSLAADPVAAGTRLAMVRFGNVLGSACSVLPIWASQLAQGGPITVTDPAMTRYFMTIPEAAGLVLQAAAYAGRADANSRAATRPWQTPDAPDAPAATDPTADVFLLDMGNPVRILDMARRFIRLHNLEPEQDVAIRITGARPGEKLHEQLAYGAEDLLPTPHPSIRRWAADPPEPAHIHQLTRTFDALRQQHHDDGPAWRDASRHAILTALHAALPEMQAAAA
jgi:O-antigen biosynthesis protein WbqV